MLGGIGMPELIVILVIALLVLGPKKLPDVARSLGEAIRGFRKAMHEPESASPEKPRHQIEEEKSIKRD